MIPEHRTTADPADQTKYYWPPSSQNILIMTDEDTDPSVERKPETEPSAYREMMSPM